MIYLFVLFFLARVLYPFAGLPLRDLGCPPDARPSPPPMGWSTGFMATPLVRGLLPSQRLLPALPEDSRLWSGLDTLPMVALQDCRIILVSPEGILRMANFPSLDMSCA